MAGKQVQRRRGTTAQHTPFIGALGEVTVDTVKMVEVVHDGTTPGGFPQASARDIVNATAATDAKLALKVSQDSATGVAKIPSGTTGQRPVTPQVGDFRYNSTTKKFEGWADPALGWAPVGGDSIPLFSVFWVPLRTAIPAGFVVADGQALTRATYPDAWAGIAAGNVPIATEANWGATPVYRGCYTTGDGTSWFRVPDYNGKTAGTVGALVLRGDGLMSTGNDGLIQPDQFQSHVHAIYKMHSAAGASQYYTNINPVVAAAINNQYGNLDLQTNPALYYTDPGSGAARVGNETRGMNVTGCWAIKLFGAVINPGAADAAQLATEVANIKAELQNSVYKRTNILDTVVQIGGVPQRGLIESSSNANGRYVRFADGTQWCWNQVNLGNIGVTTPIGNLFYNSFNGLPFAASFASSPSVDINVVTSSGVIWTSQGSAFAAPNATQNYVLMSPLSNNNFTASAVWFAVGRWF